MTDLDYAPPSFMSAGKKVIFVDFIRAEYHLDFDVSAENEPDKAIVRSNITFTARDSGFPAIVCQQRVDSIYLNGSEIRVEAHKSPDKEDSFKVLSEPVSPGTHVVNIVNRLDQEGPRGFPVSWIEPTKVECIFKMADGDARNIICPSGPYNLHKGEFLGAFLPANYNYDHFQMSFTVTIRHTDAPHSVFTNGVISGMSGDWTIDFPEFYTSSCPWFHLAPTEKYKFRREEFSSSDGRTIPVLVYAKRVARVDRQLDRFLRRARECLGQLELDFGPFPHDSLTIFARDACISMEYAGATETTFSALRHELDHSYFARSVIPVNGNAGWIDEAIAVWGDENYRKVRPSRRTNMACRTPYIRTTHPDAYSAGYKFMAYLNSRLESTGSRQGLKVFLKHYATQRRHRSIDVREFLVMLENFHGKALKNLFKQWVGFDPR